MSRTLSKSTGADRVDLRHDDPRPVLVHAQGEDRFFMEQVAHAVTACAMKNQVDSYLRDMNEKWERLKERILQWCTAEAAIERAVFSSDVETARGLLVLVQAGDEFSPDLEDRVTALDLQLDRDFPEFKIFVRLVPKSSSADLSAYVKGPTAIELYGERRGSPSKG